MKLSHKKYLFAQSSNGLLIFKRLFIYFYLTKLNDINLNVISNRLSYTDYHRSNHLIMKYESDFNLLEFFKTSRQFDNNRIYLGNRNKSFVSSSTRIFFNVSKIAFIYLIFLNSIPLEFLLEEVLNKNYFFSESFSGVFFSRRRLSFLS